VPALLPRFSPWLLALVVTAAAVATPAPAHAAKRESWKALPEKVRGPADGPRPARSRMFAADSVWNRTLPQGAGLDPTSGARVQALTDLIRLRRALPAALGGGPPNLAAGTFSTPIYRVPALTPRVRVTLKTGSWGNALRKALAGGVPIPDGAAQAVGSDGHLSVYQPATDTLWEFWRAHRRADGWHASWGGVMRRASRNPGYYTGNAWPGLSGKDGWTWGSTASSLPVAAGTVTVEELRRGRIDHALAMAVPDPCRGVFAWPAQRTDGTSSRPDCLPLGAHLRLDPGLNVAALGLHPVARMLAEAAQRHGMIVRDRTRVSAQFFLESPPTGGSPYTGVGGLFGRSSASRVLAGFPWDRLQLLPMQLCRRAPCSR